MNYSEVLDYLYKSLPMFHRVGSVAFKPGLGNTIELCRRIGNPQTQFKSVHVAGTNGKGSSSHMLAAVTQSAGYKTGLYTSPHLKSFTERIKIDGREIEEEAVVRFVEANLRNIEEIQPSFFELTVAMCFSHFAEKHVDIAIIETGLGGRLDSTNIILPLVSLITNISYDHQAILGNTLQEIAREKAGIIKQGIPIVISEMQQEVKEVFINRAAALSSPIFFGAQLFKMRHATHMPDALVADVLDKDGNIVYPLLKSGLMGTYQLKNIPGVLATIGVLQQAGLELPEAAIRSGIAEVTGLTGLKGRWQVVNKNPLIICDTGHNVAGVEFIVEQLRLLNFDKLYWMLGVVNDKDCDSILKLLPKEAYFIFCKADIPRALDANILAGKAAGHGLQGIVIEEVGKAYSWVKSQSNPKDLIMIGGSTFVVAEIEDL